MDPFFCSSISKSRRATNHPDPLGLLQRAEEIEQAAAVESRNHVGSEKDRIGNNRTGWNKQDGSNLLAESAAKTGLVPEVGLEPTRPEGQRILNPPRLPVPPLRLISLTGIY